MALSLYTDLLYSFLLTIIIDVIDLTAQQLMFFVKTAVFRILVNVERLFVVFGFTNEYLLHWYSFFKKVFLHLWRFMFYI